MYHNYCDHNDMYFMCTTPQGTGFSCGYILRIYHVYNQYIKWLYYRYVWQYSSTSKLPYWLTSIKYCSFRRLYRRDYVLPNQVCNAVNCESPNSITTIQSLHKFLTKIEIPNVIPLKSIGAATKWPPFSRRHFQMYVLERKCLNFHWYFAEVHSQGSNWQHFSIGLDNDLVPKRRQAIIWTNGGLVYWHIYASFGLNALRTLMFDQCLI